MSESSPPGGGGGNIAFACSAACCACFSASRARRSFNFNENIATERARLTRLCLMRDFLAAASAAELSKKKLKMNLNNNIIIIENNYLYSLHLRVSLLKVHYCLYLVLVAELHQSMMVLLLIVLNQN